MPWKVAEAVWTVTGHPIADRWCENADWIYCPKNDFIPIRKSRVAVTVHGAHELDPQIPHQRTIGGRLNRLRRRTSYRRMLRQAALVLTVSDFLKEQMIRMFQVEPAKCCVVGNGVEPCFFQAASGEAGSSGEPAGRPFVLCVGGLNYLDGGDRVLRLASLLRTKTPDVKVLVAGSQHEEAMKGAAAELPNITLLGYVPAERLAMYMRDSFALVFPTRYETFGIAAAEAMAAGAPVITCRCTAVPEIVGDAAIYVDPDQPESIVEALIALQSQQGLREELISRGHARARLYTWPACVDRLQQALEKG
jgi:glycosyltransferase involved in cell wall biosynthesis